MRRLINFPFCIIKNFEMFTDCFGFLSELCHFLGDEIVFSEPIAVEMPHAVGFVGKNGRGSAEHCGVEGRIDIITGTLGKALGGASGGYTSAKAEVVEWLRQRSRPYLFSNTLAPVIAAASLKVFDLIEKGDALRKRLSDNADLFRTEMTKLGFTLAGEGHPIIPVMMSVELFDESRRPLAEIRLILEEIAKQPR